MNLYKINNAILSCIDEETGEVDVERYQQLQLKKSVKLENIALWIKDLKAEATALKAEKQAFEQRQKAAENKAASLEKLLKSELSGKKFSTPKVAVSFRRAASVNVTDVFALGAEYTVPAPPKPDKKAIKEAIKSGEKVEGAELVEDLSMTIK